VSFPAFPAADHKPPQPQSPGPPRRNSRGPWSVPLVAGVAGLAALGLAVAVFLLFTGEPERRQAGVGQAVEGTEVEAPVVPPAQPPSEPEPEPGAEEAEAPGEWPPPRAFTARCQLPGGGCAPQCTPLAGGRCLDPCFIHTPECSRDCVQADGTCGWPPPDNE